MSDETKPQDGKAMPPASAGSQLREQIAALVHDAMRFDREEKTPKWQGGNSYAERRARQAAWQIATLFQPTLTDEEREVALLRGTESRSSDATTEETSQDGMRTERVTLEITRPTVCHYPAAAKNFVWWHLLRDVVQGERESVRVVPPGEADVEIRRIARDLEETRQQLFTAMEAVHERDAALARVVELEAAAKLAPAPNVGAGSNQPRGWLTAEERNLIAGITDDDGYTQWGQNIAKSLLARNSPPKVRLPRFPYIEQEWREALAAAGVEVEE